MSFSAAALLGKTASDGELGRGDCESQLFFKEVTMRLELNLSGADFWGRDLEVLLKSSEHLGLVWCALE